MGLLFCQPVAQVTDWYFPAFLIDVKTCKTMKGLKLQNLRDHMSEAAKFGGGIARKAGGWQEIICHRARKRLERNKPRNPKISRERFKEARIYSLARSREAETQLNKDAGLPLRGMTI